MDGTIAAGGGASELFGVLVRLSVEAVSGGEGPIQLCLRLSWLRPVAIANAREDLGIWSTGILIRCCSSDEGVVPCIAQFKLDHVQFIPESSYNIVVVCLEIEVALLPGSFVRHAWGGLEFVRHRTSRGDGRTPVMSISRSSLAYGFPIGLVLLW